MAESWPLRVLAAIAWKMYSFAFATKCDMEEGMVAPESGLNLETPQEMCPHNHETKDRDHDF